MFKFIRDEFAKQSNSAETYTFHSQDNVDSKSFCRSTPKLQQRAQVRQSGLQSVFGQNMVSGTYRNVGQPTIVKSYLCCTHADCTSDPPMADESRFLANRELVSPAISLSLPTAFVNQVVSLSEEPSLYIPSKKIKLTPEERKRKNEKKNQNRTKNARLRSQKKSRTRRPSMQKKLCWQENKTRDHDYRRN